MHNPDLKKFYDHKSNALKRGIAWEFEFWEWLQVWQESGHYEDRGHHKGQWVMARNGDVGPYSAANVKIARCETNSAESAIRRWREHSSFAHRAAVPRPARKALMKAVNAVEELPNFKANLKTDVAS